MTTLQNVMTTLRAATILDSSGQQIPDSKINYGVSERMPPPYIIVSQFEQVPTYDTCGVAYYESKFHVTTFDMSQDGAEDIASQILAAFGPTEQVTPTCMTCYVAKYTVGQIEVPHGLYQFGADYEFELKESAS